jgi:hypothetical protein
MVGGLLNGMTARIIMPEVGVEAAGRCRLGIPSVGAPCPGRDPARQTTQTASNLSPAPREQLLAGSANPEGRRLRPV